VGNLLSFLATRMVRMSVPSAKRLARLSAFGHSR
jgi:hypothetical protein